MTYLHNPFTPESNAGLHLAYEMERANRALGGAPKDPIFGTPLVGTPRPNPWAAPMAPAVQAFAGSSGSGSHALRLPATGGAATHNAIRGASTQTTWGGPLTSLALLGAVVGGIWWFFSTQLHRAPAQRVPVRSGHVAAHAGKPIATVANPANVLDRRHGREMHPLALRQDGMLRTYGGRISWALAGCVIYAKPRVPGEAGGVMGQCADHVFEGPTKGSPGFEGSCRMTAGQTELRVVDCRVDGINRRLTVVQLPKPVS